MIHVFFMMEMKSAASSAQNSFYNSSISSFQVSIKKHKLNKTVSQSKEILSKCIETNVYFCILGAFRSGSPPGRSLGKPVELQWGCKWDGNETLELPDLLPSPGAVLGQHTTVERGFPSLRHL